jgi:hypothetical protein
MSMVSDNGVNINEAKLVLKALQMANFAEAKAACNVAGAVKIGFN